MCGLLLSAEPYCSASLPITWLYTETWQLIVFWVVMLVIILPPSLLARHKENKLREVKPPIQLQPSSLSSNILEKGLVIAEAAELTGREV
jgi:hypothetical protein